MHIGAHAVNVGVDPLVLGELGGLFDLFQSSNGICDVNQSLSCRVQVYFCDPKSPWQRGSNENTNGLLRQYFPKGTDMAALTQQDLDFAAHQLNERPRQTLGWMTPSQELAEALQ